MRKGVAIGGSFLFFWKENMDLRSILKNQFGDIIIDAKQKQDKLFGFGTGAEVILDVTDLESLEKHTAQIIDFMKTFSWYDDLAFVNIESKGEGDELDLSDLSKHVDQRVKLHFRKSFNGNQTIIVDILEDKGDTVLVKWNDHGRIRKLEFKKDELTNVEKYYKI
ncbi:hypothetical protein [Mycoplasma sp. Ms02]|uniref:hypothetical protein n=1 Tax=Mycoplasma sp. Ms02 TaxID=353851 RepID=UPI001C89C864|nr:hypothetical protein [Mycoplasma sp. Ms02]QZE12161.1 hypothetical protein K4L35_02325 [Mycoplasma sp. Ms02]